MAMGTGHALPRRHQQAQALVNREPAHPQPTEVIGRLGRCAFSLPAAGLSGEPMGERRSFPSSFPSSQEQYNPRHSRGLYLGGLYRTRTCDPYHVKNRKAESQPVVYIGLMAYLMAWKRLMVVRIVATSCQHKPLLPKALPQMHDALSANSKVFGLIRGFKGSSPRGNYK